MNGAFIDKQSIRNAYGTFEEVYTYLKRLHYPWKQDSTNIIILLPYISFIDFLMFKNVKVGVLQNHLYPYSFSMESIMT